MNDIHVEGEFDVFRDRLLWSVRRPSGAYGGSVDITRSGTRKEELLTEPAVLKKMYILRRILNPMGTMDAIDFLLDKLRNTKTNGEFSTR